MGTCFALKCHFNNPCHTPLPPWIRLVVLNWMARLLRIPAKSPQQNIAQEDKYHVCRSEKPCRNHSSAYSGDVSFHKPENISTIRCKKKRTDNEMPARTGSVLHLRPQEIPTGNRLSAPPKFNVNLLPDEDLMLPDASLGSSKHLNTRGAKLEDSNFDSRCTTCDLKRLNDKVGRRLAETQEDLSKCVKELVRFAHEREKDDQLKGEWTLAAHIVDRFFIWIFLIIMAIFTLTIFLHAPKYIFG